MKGNAGRRSGRIPVATSLADTSAAISNISAAISLPQTKRFSLKRRILSKPICILFIGVAVWTLFSWNLSTMSEPGNQGNACQGYDGVLLISQGDVEGAAGTIFFLFVVNQLLYAELYNLIPWVHLSNVSHYVYDERVHGSHSRHFSLLHGFGASWNAFVDPISQQRVAFPGKPIKKATTLERKYLTVEGTGVWSSYFYPVSNFQHDDRSCRNLPLIRLTSQQIIPALHIHCPWSLRAWRYGGLPPSLRRDELAYDDWFLPMRQRGSAVIKKYIRFAPHMHDLARQASPSNRWCLALHIRHADKANRRLRIPVRAFLPYVQAYMAEVTAGGHNDASIYLATDSHKVIEEVQSSWPADVVARMHWQHGAVRSNDTTPVFTIGSSHDATNTQVLVDILAMSRCHVLIHGLSAVSEATHYLNPQLKHNHSVNLEVPKPELLSAESFRDMIRQLSTTKNL